MASIAAGNAAEREAKRKEYRNNLKSALEEEDDPLAVYDRFIQWTVKAYGERDPSSGLLELLEEATKAFKEDSTYKSDLRYLKMWSLYASQVERPGGLSIYKYLLSNDIGTSFSLLYEGYASLLEADGRRQDAETIYRKGIKRQARPTERLKNRYKEFQSRNGTSSNSSSSINHSTSGSSLGSSSSANPLRKTSSQKSASQNRHASGSSSTAAVGSGNSTLVSLQSSRESRYAAMLAPPAPGKRPEKLRFNLSLLFNEGTEYSIQEARARSMGLLGKKWGPPPASEFQRLGTSGSSYSMPVDFNDDGHKSNRTMDSRRKSMLGGAEPTVTINTKEALADVFGMYNSPEKTRFIPGSKHAPLKKLEPMTPSLPLRPPVNENRENRENDDPMKCTKTPTPAAFRPFVDENAQSSRTPGPAKFTPFVDPEANKTPSVSSRPALSLKASGSLSTPSSSENPLGSSRSLPNKLQTVSEAPEPVFSNPVFTPVEKPQQPPQREVVTDDMGKPTPRLALAERSKSVGDILPSSTSEPFKPFVDEDPNAKTPFAGKVFSRPPGSNVFTPKTPSAAFTPFVDSKPTFTPKPTFIPFKDASPVFTPSIEQQPQHSPEVLEEQEEEALQAAAEPSTTSFAEDEEMLDGVISEGPISESTSTTSSEYQDEYYPDEGQQHHYETPLNGDAEEYYEEGESYQEVEAPLGGRFGRFNVMTPITERTFEFTTTTTVRTPSGGYGSSRRSSEDSLFPQRDEQGAALAAQELAAELREEELDPSGPTPLEPLRLPVAAGNESMSESMIDDIPTGSLSLGDTLTLNTQFKPPNPCSQFDPAVVRSLLARVLPDAQCFDYLDRECNQLDALQKFGKKSRKSSDGTVYSLQLVDHRFSVTEKVGEGGFGAVFRAQDLGNRAEDDDDDDFDDDEDDENASVVAVKVVKPRNQWEYRVLRRLHSVLPSSLRRSVVLPQALYVFRDESYLILEYCSQGTLLNIVNGAVAAGVSQQGGCLDELLVVFFTIELLRLLESMHDIGFIHGDLKIDNCLLRLEDVPGGASAWTSVYQPNGDGGWSHKGLKVIDFGRTIDTRLFPINQQFVADWPTDERDCFEARENRPFTYETDYFGLTGIIYCMLFGKYMQTSAVVSSVDETGQSYYKVGTPFKRYWQSELWHRLFRMLLNPRQVKPDSTLPLCDELAGIRGEMEEWLQANCNRTSGTLKGLLKKVEVSCYTR